jgi:membrane protein YdbS with pleckstrin-like domain
VVSGSTRAIAIEAKLRAPTDARRGHMLAAVRRCQPTERDQMSVKLHPGEQVIFEGHPSWRGILAFYIKGVLIAVVVGAIVALVSNISGDTDKALVFFVVLVIIGVTVLVGFIKRVATTYTVTNRRLNIKRGIISREIQETRLERVQNVNYQQSAIQRLLQVGDVDFDTAAGDDYNFIFAGVADPAEVVHQVDEATGAHAAGGQGLGEPQPPQ